MYLACFVRCQRYLLAKMVPTARIAGWSQLWPLPLLFCLFHPSTMLPSFFFLALLHSVDGSFSVFLCSYYSSDACLCNLPLLEHNCMP